jgi:hypothetical protein
MLLALDALARGYRVVISTHSTDVIDVVWALRELQAKNGKPEQLLEVVGLDGSPRADTVRMARACLAKKVRAYFFQPVTRRGRVGTVGKDISSLDPASPDDDVGGWGGLTDFSSRTASVVAKVNAKRLGR